MKKTERCVLRTAIGTVALEATEGAVVRVDLHVDDEPQREPEDPVLCLAARQIQEYLASGRRSFDVPQRRPPDTTPFQHRVWDALLAIPLGETRTYGELAAALGTSARAVGGACRRNPLPILVPCHRVVAKNGLGGFSGAWQDGPELDMKRALLSREDAGCVT